MAQVVLLNLLRHFTWKVVVSAGVAGRSYAEVRHRGRPAASYGSPPSRADRRPDTRATPGRRRLGQEPLGFPALRHADCIPNFTAAV